jgi:hypothetical protein
MPAIDLYLDIDTKNLLQGLNRSVPFQLPDLHQEDRYVFNVYPVKRRSYAAAPYFSYIGANGWQAKLSIGTAGVINAFVDLITLTANSNGITGSALNLDTAAITALTDGAEQIFEVRLTDGVNPYRAQQRIKIRKSVYTSGALNPVQNDTALGSNEAKSTYVAKELGPGEGIIFNSEDGTQRRFLFLGNDGQIRWPALT